MSKDEHLVFPENVTDTVIIKAESARAVAADEKVYEALLGSEARYRAVVEDQMDFICRMLPDTTLTFVNKAWCNYFHVTSEDVLSRKHADLMPPAYRASFLGDIESLRVDQPVKTVESELVLPSGDHLWMQSVYRGIFDSSGRLTEIQTVARDVTYQKQVEERLKASLREQEALIKEVHHRVKNNLQIITSLLNLQSSLIEDATYRNLVQDSQNRIKSMALVHELLYRSRDLSSINISEYLHILTQNMLRSYGRYSGTVDLRVDVEEIYLDVDKAVPVGLIVTELFSNALKYAFPAGGKGEIRVALRKSGERILLRVSDNGTGFPADYDVHRSTTLGLQLVELLTQQLEGTFDLERTEGASFLISFFDM